MARSASLSFVLMLFSACVGTEPAQKVTVHAVDVDLLAVKGEGETWRTLDVPPTGETTASFGDGTFVVAAVCDYRGPFSYQLVYGGPGLEEVDVGCLHLRGEVVEVSVVPTWWVAAIGEDLGGAVGRASVPPGTYDVVAYERALPSPHFEIRRAVSIVSDTVVTLDPQHTAAGLEPMVVTTDPSGYESVRTRVDVWTESGSHLPLQFFDGDGTWRIPSTALLPTDIQTVTATASWDLGGRSVTRQAPDGSRADLSLPPVLSLRVTSGPDGRVTWDPIPGSWNAAEVTASDPTGQQEVRATFTEQWFAATGSPSELPVSFPPEIPGWRPGWAIAPWEQAWALTLEQRGSNRELDRVWRSGIAPKRDANP